MVHPKDKLEEIPIIIYNIYILTLERMISGARYSGVPHNVQVRPLTLLAKPKSVIYK